MSIYIYMNEFFNNLQERIEGTIEKVKNVITNKKNEIANNIQETIIFKKGIVALFWGIKQCEFVKMKSKQIYNSHVIIKTAVDVSVYSVYYILACFCNQHIEPFKTNWICSSILMKKTTLCLPGMSIIILSYMIL